MKYFFSILLTITTIIACKPKVNLDENLPQDIANKPAEKTVYEIEEENLSSLRRNIIKLLENETCDNPNNWGYTAIGMKPCGGPRAYIAYPKKIKDKILPLINEFTKKTDEFNKKHQLTSDCEMVPPPFGVKCVDGKAVLNTSNINKDSTND